MSELASLVEAKRVGLSVLINADDVLTAVGGVELDDLLIEVDPVQDPN